MWFGPDTIPQTTLRFSSSDLVFGDGVSTAIPRVLDRLGIDELLVVTDRGVVDAGITDAVVEGVTQETRRHLATREPSTNDFSTGGTASADGILAVGGGSVLDTAKVLSILMMHGGSIAGYLGVDTVPGPVPPIIAVPTTSGTGSQATQTAVIAHAGVKRGISSEYLRPEVAVVDPVLTSDLPPEVTATSGFDALMHAFESLTARDYRNVPDRPINYQGANPVSCPLSWQALQLIHSALERAVDDGSDLGARRMMSLGSHLAGLAFSNAGLGIVHALASTVGGLTEAPHGACLGASFQAGFVYNQPVRTEAYAWIAQQLGLSDPMANDDACVGSLREEFDRIRAAIGLPGSFGCLGLGHDDVEIMVDNTVSQDRRLATTPRLPDDELRPTIESHL